MAGTAQTGNPRAFLQKVEYYFDPATGPGRRETWVGSTAAIDAKAAEIQAAGLKYTQSQKGPSKSLVCDVPSQSGATSDQEIADTYEFDAEFAQESVYANPKLLAAATTTETLADWKYLIEKALSAKPPTGLITPSSPTPPDPAMQAIYDLRARGVETFEPRRLVFRRTRTLPLNHASKVIMTAIEHIWTTVALISDFAIPAPIAAEFPADPTTTPVGCIWGWKYRKDTSQILWGIAGKKTEIKEWVFGALPTIMYDV